jgi:hypothetical protein
MPHREQIPLLCSPPQSILVVAKQAGHGDDNQGTGCSNVPGIHLSIVQSGKQGDSESDTDSRSDSDSASDNDSANDSASDSVNDSENAIENSS